MARHLNFLSALPTREPRDLAAGRGGILVSLAVLGLFWQSPVLGTDKSRSPARDTIATRQATIGANTGSKTPMRIPSEAQASGT